jgi:hypothetical protein
MSVELLHLRKLLQLLYAGQKQQQLLIRSEIRNDLMKIAGKQSAGGDFYAPFWSDVKDHALGKASLADLSKRRVEANARRERLYPVLTAGFLKWWTEQRRWTNEPFELIRGPSALYNFNKFLTIKIDNFLSIRDGRGIDRYIYPYFYELPPLKNEAARIALWIFKSSFPALNFDNFEILDVTRGRIFAPDRCYLEGDEKQILTERYEVLWRRYIELEENFNK